MTDPDSLRLLRDRLLVLGYPADDLPDWAVSLLAEGLEDKARLEWLALHAQAAVYDATHSTWRVHGLPPVGSHERRELRDAIDAARAAMGAERSPRALEVPRLSPPPTPDPFDGPTDTSGRGMGSYGIQELP